MPFSEDLLRALVVSYTFPPVGGAGVQRVAKLVKYLPAHGITPVVLTALNPSVPLHDQSLADDLPSGLEVIRARTFEPGYRLKQAVWNEAPSGRKSWKGALAGAARQMLVPDPQILWQPAARRALAGALRERHLDVVLISGPPFSQFLLAPLVRRRPGTAVVLDYRDEWSTYRESYEMMGRLGARVGERLEDWLVTRAHAIVTATEAFRDNLLRRFPQLEPARVVAIPNGYDPQDFPTDLPTPPRDRFVLTYAGTIFRLTSPRGLLGALRLLAQQSPALAQRLDVRFVGRVVETEAALFHGAPGVRREGYMPHDAVLRALAASHMTLCLLDDVPGAERVYPAKIFELMHLGRPILTLAPPGALAELVQRHRLGVVVHPRDEAGIAREIASAIQAQEDGTLPLRSSAQDIDRFHRRALASEFAAVLRTAVRAARA